MQVSAHILACLFIFEASVQLVSCSQVADERCDDRGVCQSHALEGSEEKASAALLQLGRQVSSQESLRSRELPLPAKGPLLWSMIRSDPWKCDLLPSNDRRQSTCRIKPDSAELYPETLTCGEDDSCSIEHANSFRTLSHIGALPCCPTPPFCGAPRCSPDALSKAAGATCTKRDAAENVEYLKNPDSWPAYAGWGGAYELDTAKLMDALACRGRADCPDKTFDLAIDLGANTGYYTEKLTVRNFAKNYVMIEANPKTSAVLHERWANKTWKEAWFTEQVVPLQGAVPDFEIITKALSNHSKGKLDMCWTEGSLRDSEEGCMVRIASPDHLIPSKLSAPFQEHFAKAQSAFIKIDTEGMDELVIRGMKDLLEITRGHYEDESPRHLVNFFQFEFAPYLMSLAKQREGFQKYDIESVTKFLESVGFETFLIGPRYLPLSHGSWDKAYKTWPSDVRNNAGANAITSNANYPDFDDRICPWCKDSIQIPTFTADIFAIRSSHPRATELKLALGACQESKDFDIHDEQYVIMTEKRSFQDHKVIMKGVVAE